MLIKEFDYLVAFFPSFSAIDLAEVRQADLVRIGEYHSAGIYHAQKMRWEGSLRGLSDPLGLIRSSKERKAVMENKAAFEQEGYSFATLPLTLELYEEFVELYKVTTQTKVRWTNVNLKEQVLSKFLVGSPSYLVCMFKDKKLESALAFALKNQTVMVSVGAKRNFPGKRGGVGGVLEVELAQFCLDHQLTEINHGVSQNPAGVSANAGIFEFKARYGFSAFPELKWQTTFILSAKPALSDLVFVSLHQNQLTQLILSDSAENLSKRYQTPHVQSTIQLSLTETIAQHRAFLLSQT